MKTHPSDLQSPPGFWKRNPVFLFLLCAQLALALWLLASAFTPPLTVELPPEAFSMDVQGAEDTALELSGGELQLWQDQASEQHSQLSTALPGLRPGAYTLTVDYQSAKDLYEPSTSLLDYTATCAVASSAYPDDVAMEALRLDDGHTQAQGRLWIAWGAKTEDLRLTVDYQGQGMLTISSLRLEEQPLYRWLQLGGLLLLFAAIDLCYCAFFANGFGPLARQPQKWRTGFCLAGIAAAASLPVFISSMYYGCDLPIHMERIVQVADELAAGQFPVRMATGALNGYGEAISLFYCDLFLYLPALLYNGMVPLQTCYHIYVALVNAATCLTAYACFRRLAGSRLGLLGSALYTLAVYRLMDIYVRAALGEYTAMIFLPLVLLGAVRIYQTEKPLWRDWLPLALGMSGIVQCHLLTVEMTALFLLLLCLVCLRRTLHWRRILALGKAAALTVGLCAWFLLPFLSSLSMPVGIRFAENGGVGYLSQMQQKGSFPIQLLGVFPAWKNGADLANMPLTVGLPALLGLGLLGLCLLKKTEWQLEAESPYRPMRLMAAFGLLAILPALYCFPWNLLEHLLGTELSQLLGNLQFGWRFLALALALLTGATLLCLKLLSAHAKAAAKTAGLLLLCGLALSSGMFFSQLADTATSESYLSFGRERRITSDGFYLPSGTDRRALLTSSAPYSESEDVELEGWERRASRFYVTCSHSGDEPAQLSLPILLYDHYQVTDEVTGEAFALENGPNNTIQLTLPGGYEGTLVAAYQPPLSWRFAEGLSLLCYALLLTFLLWRRRAAWLPLHNRR